MRGGGGIYRISTLTTHSDWDGPTRADVVTALFARSPALSTVVYRASSAFRRAPARVRHPGRGAPPHAWTVRAAGSRPRSSSVRAVTAASRRTSLLFFGRHPTRSPRPGGSPLPPPSRPPTPTSPSLRLRRRGCRRGRPRPRDGPPVADDAAESSAAPSSAASSLARVSSAAAASLGAFARRLLARFPPCPAVFPRSTPALRLQRVLPDVLASIGRTPMLRVASCPP